MKKKVKSFVYLPPSFTDILSDLKEHTVRNYLISFIRVLGIPIRNAYREKDFETVEKLKSCHDILVFLWAIELKYKVISKMKTRILTPSKMFSDWSRNVHENIFNTEID